MHTQSSHSWRRTVVSLSLCFVGCKKERYLPILCVGLWFLGIRGIYTQIGWRCLLKSMERKKLFILEVVPKTFILVHRRNRISIEEILIFYFWINPALE